MDGAFEQQKVYIAVKGGVIVGGLQHPVYAITDWQAYEKASKAENVMARLDEIAEFYKSEIDSFFKQYDDCEIGTLVADDFMTALITTKALSGLETSVLPVAEGLRIRNLGGPTKTRSPEVCFEVEKTFIYPQ